MMPQVMQAYLHFIWWRPPENWELNKGKDGRHQTEESERETWMDVFVVESLMAMYDDGVSDKSRASCGADGCGASV